MESKRFFSEVIIDSTTIHPFTLNFLKRDLYEVLTFKPAKDNQRIIRAYTVKNGGNGHICMFIY